jgi:hypothetical protein
MEGFFDLKLEASGRRVQDGKAIPRT